MDFNVSMTPDKSTIEIMADAGLDISVSIMITDLSDVLDLKDVIDRWIKANVK